MGGQKTLGVIHNEAFQFLKKNYKVMWVISLVLYGVSMALGIVMSIFTVPLQFLTTSLAPLFAQGHNNSDIEAITMLGSMFAVFGLFWGIISVVSIAVSMLEYASYIGGYNATLQALDGNKPSFNGVWQNFGRNWKRYIGVVAWATLWEMIWSLLFIVPGIVKSYSYKLAPFLVLQCPDMTVRQALRKSIEVTNGYKGRLFGLDVLLFLWSLASIVGICLLFIGFLAIQLLWIMPLMLLYYSIAYTDIRQAAIEKGILPGLEPFGEQLKV